MKSKKTTRRALFSSFMSLLLCCSMLVGTTFAWFTDTVTSTGNIIKSGTLDVEMRWANNLSEKDTTKWDDASTTKIFNYQYWEPGYTDVKFVNIKNVGDLAFKYQLNIVPSAQPEAGKPDLADVIEVYMIPVKDVNNFPFDRAAADMLMQTSKGTLLSALIAEPDGAAHGVMLPVEGNTQHIAPESVKDAVIGEATYCIVLHMQESADNKYQNLSVGEGFAVQLLAAQMTYEKDSFDEQYDQNTGYDSWNAAADSSWYNDTDTEFVLTSAEELAGLAKLVNNGTDTFAGKTVKLGADIDLNGISWTPIGRNGDWSVKFNGTFIGTGYTISNLHVTGTKGLGLFGYVGNAAHIEGVTIDGAYVSGNDYVGAVMGTGYLAANCLKDCTVKNAEIIAMPYLLADGETYDGGAKAGAVAGYAINGNITGNKVINCSVTAYRDLGGIAGMVAGENRSVTVSGNSVENLTLIYVRALPYADDKVNGNRESVVGRCGKNVTVADDNVENNVTLATDIITCVSSAKGLAAALTADEKNIHVVLADDIDLPISSLGAQTPGSGQYKLGGESTEKITIDLNGNKLNITTSYWSAIGAKNDTAVITIKNGSMTSSQTSGTWNSYDLGFTDCQYVIENVVFDKAIYLDSAATLKDVTVNETHDYYAIWIPANGQTVEINGLTVNSGRGIKIDEQYCGDETAKVTLAVSNATFETAKKAAILVKSVAGADITLSNVDITKVAADTTNAVWVDEDAAAYASLVTVTGGNLIVEPADVSNGNDLVKELNAGKNVTLTSDVKIDPANISNAYGTTGISVTNGQTIDGNGHTLDIKGAGGTWDSGINTTGGLIKNITVTGSFRGIFINHNSTHSERVILENVTIDGTVYTISCDQGMNQGLTATESTFNGWTSYAGTLGDAKFVNCSFGEGSGYAFCRPYAPTEFVGCEFEAGYKLDPRAAVTFENCTLDGVAITAENLATLVTSNIANATVK